MVSIFNLVVGGLGVVLGVAWIVWPMTMVFWQNKLLYFWVSDEPQVDQVSPLVARIGGAILVVAGAVLMTGFRP